MTDRTVTQLSLLANGRRTKEAEKALILTRADGQAKKSALLGELASH